MNNIIYIILSSIIFTLDIVFVYYLSNLKTKGCTCALNYRRDYIMYYIIFNFSLSVLMLFYSFRHMLMNRNVNILIILFFLLTALHIVCIVFIFQYIDMLKTTNCKCSESIIRDILYVYNILDTSAMIISFINFLLFIFLLTSVFVSMNDKNIKAKIIVKPKTKSKLKKKI